MQTMTEHASKHNRSRVPLPASITVVGFTPLEPEPAGGVLR